MLVVSKSLSFLLRSFAEQVIINLLTLIDKTILTFLKITVFDKTNNGNMLRIYLFCYAYKLTK